MLTNISWGHRGSADLSPHLLPPWVPYQALCYGEHEFSEFPCRAAPCTFRALEGAAAGKVGAWDSPPTGNPVGVAFTRFNSA